MNKTFMLWILALFLVIPLAFGTNYFISDCAGLQNIQNDVTGNYELSNNIDCSDSINWNSGEGFIPIANFSGQLNGNGYIVDRLYINRSSLDQGLFSHNAGYSQDLGVIIQNLGLENVNFTCGAYCGAFAGWNVGYLINSYATGSINGVFNAHIGGLVGVNLGVVNNTWANVSLCGYYMKGGLISDNINIVQNSYSLSTWGEINVCDNGNDRAGICAGAQGPGTAYSSFYASDIGGPTRSYCGSPWTGDIMSNSTNMKKRSTYPDWDLVNTWQFCDRERPPVFPSLQVFGLCCVGSWECSKYSVCGNNKQECLKAIDKNCGYTYNASLDIPLSQFDKNCSINAQSPDISITNFDLRYSSNVLLLGLILALWIALFILYFAFGNYAFAGANILLGVFLFILLFQQIFWVFALLFPICSIMAIIFLNKGD